MGYLKRFGHKSGNSYVTYLNIDNLAYPMGSDESFDLVNNFKTEHLGEEDKTLLLELLGYALDDEMFIIDKSNNRRVICPYSKKYVHFSTASILPGSTIIVNTSPYTLSCYISDYLREDKNGSRTD